jgi:hypothetical protein
MPIGKMIDEKVVVNGIVALLAKTVNAYPPVRLREKRAKCGKTDKKIIVFHSVKI